jgi:hypothetical protein
MPISLASFGSSKPISGGLPAAGDAPSPAEARIEIPDIHATSNAK